MTLSKEFQQELIEQGYHEDQFADYELRLQDCGYQVSVGYEARYKKWYAALSTDGNYSLVARATKKGLLNFIARQGWTVVE